MQPTINDHPMKVIVVDETGQTINDHPLMVTPVGGEGGTPITVEKDGTSVVTNLATLNFTGAGAVTRNVIDGVGLDNLTNNVAYGLTFVSNFARIQASTVVANNTIMGFTTGLTILGDNAIVTGNMTDSDITIDATADKTLLATNNLGGGTLTDNGTNTLAVNNIA